MEKLFLIISLVLYAYAPEYFSGTYCWVLFIIFIANAAYIYVRDLRYEKIGFNIFFTIAFFLVTYLYPIFISPFFPDFLILSIPLYNYEVVSQGTALANVAYACYGVGYIYILNNAVPTTLSTSDVTVENREIAEILTEKQVRMVTLVCVVLFGIFVVSGGLTFFRMAYHEGENESFPGISGFVWIFLQTFCLVVMMANFKRNSITVYAVLAVIIVTLLAVGTRTLPLNLLIPAMYYYCYKKNLRLSRIVMAGGVVIAVFMIVGFVRANGTAMDAAGGDAIAEKFRAFMDFIIPNRDLYVIFSHVQNDGITYGISSMSYILATIPFMQSVFIKLTGLPEYMLASERMTTYWEFGDDPNAWGLGTNIIGDVYLSFGFVGVILLFLFLGYFVAKSRELMIRKNRTGTLLYMILTSGSVFMCRGAYFYSFKNVVWTLLIVYIVRCLYKEVVYDERENKIMIAEESTKTNELA